jgi:hypothetical protein
MKMPSSDYSKTLKVDATMQAAEQALTRDIPGWWSEDLESRGNAFTVGFGETKKSFQTSKPVSGGGGFDIVWNCTAANLLHPDVSVSDEWVGTRILWKIRPVDSGIAITLTHQGLNDMLQCHEICVGGWNFFFAESLKSYLETGQGDKWSH